MDRSSIVALGAGLAALAFIGTVGHFAVKLQARAQVPTTPDVRLWVDKGTGCEYLVTDDSIIPRLYSDGVPVCPGQVDEFNPPEPGPAWEGGTDESPILDGTEGMIWDDQEQAWFQPGARPIADDVEDTALLEGRRPILTF